MLSNYARQGRSAFVSPLPLDLCVRLLKSLDEGGLHVDFRVQENKGMLQFQARRVLHGRHIIAEGELLRREDGTTRICWTVAPCYEPAAMAYQRAFMRLIGFLLVDSGLLLLCLLAGFQAGMTLFLWGLIAAGVLILAYPLLVTNAAPRPNQADYLMWMLEETLSGAHLPISSRRKLKSGQFTVHS